MPDLDDDEYIILAHSPAPQTVLVMLRDLGPESTPLIFPSHRSFLSDDFILMATLMTSPVVTIVRPSLLEAYGIDKHGLKKIIDFYGRDRIIEINLARRNYEDEYIYLNEAKEGMIIEIIVKFGLRES